MTMIAAPTTEQQNNKSALFFTFTQNTNKNRFVDVNAF